MKKIVTYILVLYMILTFVACGSKTSSDSASVAPGSNVVILYTNDIHCGLNDNLTAAGIATAKSAIEATGKQVILVDCGDAIQGNSIGTLSKGEDIVDTMNQLGYSVAGIGNHEFDYGMDQFFALKERAKFPYVSANFVDAEGKTVLDPYTIIEADGAKIAFVGASTPTTLRSSTPTYFKNEKGEFIYGFCQDDTGEAVYSAIQKAVDDAKKDGADYVFLLAHLGIEAECVPYTSSDIITHTTGIDVVLDGHSHTVMESESVNNANGEPVIVSQTGTKLSNIGCLSISKDGKFFTKLINDNGVGAFVDEINDKFDEVLGEVVAHSDIELHIYDPKTGERMCRSNETNLGDLAADGLRYATGADIALINGGGLRSAIPAGEITNGSIIAVHPFNNEVCVVEAAGQEILDALELSASCLPGEFGGFLQVSGLTFTIDVSVKPSVSLDNEGMFVSIDGDRRVRDVMVGEEPIDPEKVYTVASLSYTLHNQGDGYTMFKDNNFVLDGIMLDNQALSNFLTEALNGSISEEYKDPYGQGRINIIGG